MKNLITQHHARSQSTWAMGLFTMTLLTACGGGGDGVDSLAVDASLSLPPATAPAFKPSPAGTSQYQLHLDAATANAGTEFAGEQRRRGARHRHVENASGVDLLHRTAVVGQHRQKADELLDLFFDVRLVDVQSATVFGDLPQRPVRREVEDVALLLDDLLRVGRGAVWVAHRPGRLHPEGRLKVGFRAGGVAQHEDARPRFNRHARG